jgi:hypothetical protein
MIVLSGHAVEVPYVPISSSGLANDKNRQLGKRNSKDNLKIKLIDNHGRKKS